MSTLIGIAQTSLTNMTLQKKVINIDPEIPSIVISSTKTNTDTANKTKTTTQALFLKADKIDFVYWAEPNEPEVTTRITDRTLGIPNSFFTQSMNLDRLVIRKTYTYTDNARVFDGIVGYWQNDNSFDFTVDNDFYQTIGR